MLRQIQRLYDSVLSMSQSLSQLAASVPQLKEPKNPSTHQELAQVLAEALKPKPAEIDFYEYQGLRLLLDRASLLDRVIIEQGSWEFDQTNFLTSFMQKLIGRPSGVFLDIGAYWGLYSLLAMRAGVEHIYAFEPDRHNFAQLCAQIFLNNASSLITPVNKAVSDSSGEVQFWDSRNHPGGNRAGVCIVGKDFSRPTYRVDSISIDQYLELRDATVLIKLDVEGHEDKALRGMEKTISRNKIILQIELFDQNADRILPVLASFGLVKMHRIAPDSYYTNAPELFG
jgi:FkbM family methyltransferase